MTFGYSRPPSPLPCSGLRLKPPEQQPALQAEVTPFFPGLLAALDKKPKNSPMLISTHAESVEIWDS